MVGRVGIEEDRDNLLLVRTDLIGCLNRGRTVMDVHRQHGGTDGHVAGAGATVFMAELGVARGCGGVVAQNKCCGDWTAVGGRW